MWYGWRLGNLTGITMHVVDHSITSYKVVIYSTLRYIWVCVQYIFGATDSTSQTREAVSELNVNNLKK